MFGNVDQLNIREVDWQHARPVHDETRIVVPYMSDLSHNRKGAHEQIFCVNGLGSAFTAFRS